MLRAADRATSHAQSAWSPSDAGPAASDNRPLSVVLHTQRGPVSDTACGVVSNSLDSLTESRSLVVLSRVTVDQGVIGKRSSPQHASAGSNHRRHAQCSATVFAANPTAMPFRRWSHPTGQPVRPASIQPDQPAHSIPRCPGMRCHPAVIPDLSKSARQHMLQEASHEFPAFHGSGFRGLRSGRSIPKRDR